MEINVGCKLQQEIIYKANKVLYCLNKREKGKI